MTSAQTHPCVAVVILIEQQTLMPVRIFLKFAIAAKARTLAILISLEN